MRINCADAITLLTGNLTVPVERLYTLYNGLTGDNLFTHQLPRAFRACQPHAEQAFPRLAEWLRDPDRAITTENWRQIVAAAKKVFGDRFDLEPVAD